MTSGGWSAETERVPQDVKQFSRGFFVELKPLADFAGDFALGAAVSVDLDERSPVALENGIGRVDRVMDRLPIPSLLLERLDQRHDAPSRDAPRRRPLAKTPSEASALSRGEPAGGGALIGRPEGRPSLDGLSALDKAEGSENKARQEVDGSAADGGAADTAVHPLEYAVPKAIKRKARKAHRNHALAARCEECDADHFSIHLCCASLAGVAMFAASLVSRVPVGL